MANDELYTPKSIFDALGTTFDLDVCAPVEGAKYTPTEHWYSELDDGLSKPWFGRVWMNPPYSKPEPWVNKWLDHKNGFALIPFAKSNWFGTLWDSDAVGVRLPTNLKFITKNDVPYSIWMPVGLWAIGSSNIEILRKAGYGRVR